MSLKTKSYFKVAQMILALDEIAIRGYNTSEAGEVLAQLSQRIRKSNKSLDKIYSSQETEGIGHFQSLIQRCIEEQQRKVEPDMAASDLLEGTTPEEAEEYLNVSG